MCIPLSGSECSTEETPRMKVSGFISSRRITPRRSLSIPMRFLEEIVSSKSRLYGFTLGLYAPAALMGLVLYFWPPLVIVILKKCSLESAEDAPPAQSSSG